MNDSNRPIVVSTEDYKQQQISQSKSDAAVLGSDTTVEGGKYEVDGRMVDANGVEIKGAAKNDEQKANAPQGDAGKQR